MDYPTSLPMRLEDILKLLDKSQNDVLTQAEIQSVFAELIYYRSCTIVTTQKHVAMLMAEPSLCRLELCTLSRHLVDCIKTIDASVLPDTEAVRQQCDEAINSYESHIENQALQVQHPMADSEQSRHHPRSLEYWKGIMELYYAELYSVDGMRAADFFEKHNISSRSFYRWQAKLGGRFHHRPTPNDMQISNGGELEA